VYIVWHLQILVRLNIYALECIECHANIRMMNDFPVLD